MRTLAHTRIRISLARPHATLRSSVRAVFAPLAKFTNFDYNLVTFLCNLHNPKILVILHNQTRSKSIIFIYFDESSFYTKFYLRQGLPLYKLHNGKLHKNIQRFCAICYPFRKPLETFENAILLYRSKVFVYYAQNNLLKFLVLCAIYHYTDRVFCATMATVKQRRTSP